MNTHAFVAIPSLLSPRSGFIDSNFSVITNTVHTHPAPGCAAQHSSSAHDIQICGGDGEMVTGRDYHFYCQGVRLC